MRRAVEDEMVREHHWLNEHEFEQTLRDRRGQRSLDCWKLSLALLFLFYLFLLYLHHPMILFLFSYLFKLGWKRPWCWERLKAKGDEDGRGWWLDSILNSMDMNLSKLREIVKDRGVWHAAVHGVAKSWTWLNDSTTRKLSLDIMEVYFTSVWLKWSSLIYIRRMSWLKYLLILQSSSFMLSVFHALRFMSSTVWTVFYLFYIFY